MGDFIHRRRGWRGDWCLGSHGHCGDGWLWSFQVWAAIIDKFDHVFEGREVAEFQVFITWNGICAANGRKHFGLLDGVNAKIGFQIEVHIQHVNRVAGFLSRQFQNFFANWINRCHRDDWCQSWCGTNAGCHRDHLCREWRQFNCFQIRAAIINKLDDVFEGREVTQFEIFFAWNVIGAADGRKHFGLFDRVHAQVSFQIQVQIEHIHRIAGLLRCQ